MKAHATHRTRARVRKILVIFMESGGRAAPRFTRAARARARARALSTREFLQNSHFLFYNFQNNQGKSCSAPRVWQLCRSSAQSEPISKSYDRNNFASFSYSRFSQKYNVMQKIDKKHTAKGGAPIRNRTSPWNIPKTQDFTLDFHYFLFVFLQFGSVSNLSHNFTESCKMLYAF